MGLSGCCRGVLGLGHFNMNIDYREINKPENIIWCRQESNYLDWGISNCSDRNVTLHNAYFDF